MASTRDPGQRFNPRRTAPSRLAQFARWFSARRHTEATSWPRRVVRRDIDNASPPAPSVPGSKASKKSRRLPSTSLGQRRIGPRWLSRRPAIEKSIGTSCLSKTRSLAARCLGSGVCLLQEFVDTSDDDRLLGAWWLEMERHNHRLSHRVTARSVLVDSMVILPVSLSSSTTTELPVWLAVVLIDRPSSLCRLCSSPSM